MRKIIIGLCCCVLLACGKREQEVEATVAPLAAEETQRELTNGKVIGFLDGENTYAWIGIPFARAPVGELRWRAPREPEAWTGVRDMLSFKNMCMQLGGIGNNAPKDQVGKLVGSEDCLYLNVWSPRADVSAAKLPVMVWIHGGGNTSGSGSMYDFARVLAGRQKVVVVTLNYRLGIFGWFNHPALVATSSGNDTDAMADRSGNFGTLDTIQALRWVRANIAALGGDPDNVTVFGESAGGFNTYALMGSPLAQGLFHKAISQSGGFRSAPITTAQNFVDEAPAGHTSSAKELTLKLILADGLATSREQAKNYFSARSDAEITAYLRGKSPAQLFALFNSNSERLGLLDLPMVFPDGYVLRSNTTPELLADPTLLNRVPLITGTNRDEMKLFQSFDPKFVRRWFGLLPQIRDKQDYERSARYRSELWKLVGADLPATQFAQADSSVPTYVYRFDFDQLKDSWLVSLSELIGAGHGLEMTYAFGLEESPAKIFKLNSEQTLPARKKIAYAMSSYWANFAYTGSPGRGRAGDLPEWQAWSNADDGAKTLLIDADNRGGIRQTNEGLTLATLKQQLRSDPTLQKDKDALCHTYAHIFYKSMFGDWLFDAREFTEMGCDVPEK